MPNLGARWDITKTKAGHHVVYQNLVDHKRFDCGTERFDTPMDLLIMFMVTEGDPGDLVFLNGKFYTQIHKELPA